MCLGDDVDLALIDTLAELHKELHGPADRRGRKTRDRPRRESSLELPGPQEDLEPAVREGDPDAPIVCGIGRRLEEPLGLEPLYERGRRRSRHSQLGRGVLGPHAVGPRAVHSAQHRVRPAGQAVGAQGVIPGSLQGPVGAADRVRELEGEFGPIGHGWKLANMLTINISTTQQCRQATSQHVSDQSTGELAPHWTHVSVAGLPA